MFFKVLRTIFQYVKNTFSFDRKMERYFFKNDFVRESHHGDAAPFAFSNVLLRIGNRDA